MERHVLEEQVKKLTALQNVLKDDGICEEHRVCIASIYREKIATLYAAGEHDTARPFVHWYKNNYRT